MADDLSTRMVDFVQSVTTAMGLSADVSVEPLEDGTRIVINGDDCVVLVKCRAEGLDALQHLCQRRLSPRAPRTPHRG